MIQETIPYSKSSSESGKGQRVVVAMSGGVDSSVAAARLVSRGYDVVGIMMRLWSEPSTGPAAPMNRCCTPDQMADARRVAAHLQIPFHVIDVQEYFRRTIVQFFIDEHARGRTPNPCIECNREIRFSLLLDRARALGAQFLATGHYARVLRTEDGYQLLRARDQDKDQSYVLHVLGQEELSQVLFPVGDLLKTEVRDLASHFQLPVGNKEESMDLCFIGDGDYRRFLQDHAPTAAAPGPIITQSGDQLGEHQGLPFYTIGQRKGLGISAPEPLYVLHKDTERNAITVGPRSALGRTQIHVRDVNWIAGEPPSAPIPATVKIRYRAEAAPAHLSALDGESAMVTFDDFVYGVTAGQGATFYAGEVCLGGGLIDDRRLSRPLATGARQVAR